ncbi:MAG: molybdopterin-dependent oxidoreductase [Candidatus Aminicenantes bacterium]|nr:molybdopterin-dependent oxidoreductase [Candidatus Aminicenantes bacterium]
MKWGVTVTAGTAFSGRIGHSGPPPQRTAAVSRTSLKKLQAVTTTCGMCPAGCGLVAFLNGNRLVRLYGNNLHPVNAGGICAKGIAGINLVNDPERILYPMKRNGKRGSGEWTTITWDEAMMILQERLRLLMNEGRTSEILVDMGTEDPLLTQFFSLIGTSRLLNRYFWNHFNEFSAANVLTGYSKLTPDVTNARTILNFGANPMAGGEFFIGLARRLVQTRLENGAKLITFDVRLSKTAACSDAWYPLKAGTDGFLALALAHVIFKQNLADKEFISRYTKLSINDLSQHLNPYSPSAASLICGIPAKDIEKIAIDFAKNRPSIAIFGGGASDHANGRENAKSILLLNIILGNIGTKGGMNPAPIIEGFQENNLHPDETSRTAEWLWNQASSNPPSGIDTYFSFFSNPVFDDCDGSSTGQWMKSEEKLPFLAVIDTHMTETARLADLFLPAATFLESWKLSFANTLDGYAVVNLTQPAVSLISSSRTLRSPEYSEGKWLEHEFKPLGEAREPGNVCLELARRLGGPTGRHLPFKNTREYVQKKSRQLKTLAGEKSYQLLKDKGFCVLEPPASIQGKMTGRLLPVTTKDLPRYSPISAHQSLKKEEFILTPFYSNLSAYGTSNSKWCREIRHANRLWINTTAALHLGLKNGDKVKVVSPVGSLTARILLTGRIQPQSVALEHGLGHHAVGRTAMGKKFKSKDMDTLLVWWEKQGNGVNPMQIIDKKAEKTGSGPADKDTVIRIEKI